MGNDLTLVMYFKNEEGKLTTVSLKHIKDDVTEAEVKAAMDTIVTADIFTSTGGNLVTAVRAELVSKATTEFDLVIEG